MIVKSLLICFIFVLLVSFISCNNSEESNMENQINIIFLHHSTGQNIWEGGVSNFAKKFGYEADVIEWFNKYNKQNNKNYNIVETNFPKKTPYGWNNYPYDYYNIWVKNAGDEPYMEEPTLEILTKKYDVIIFKHCYPVSSIKADTISPDINSDVKTLANYKLQYEALKKKLNEFPDTKFIIWTPTALAEKATNIDEAKRANEFSDWVKNVWDTKDDNILLWDFRSLQVEEGYFFKNSFCKSEVDSHPNQDFAESVVPYFCNRIVKVIEGKGDVTSITGK